MRPLALLPFALLALLAHASATPARRQLVADRASPNDIAIRAALLSGALDCPAAVLGTGADGSPMLPYLSSVDCLAPLADLFLPNGSSLPDSWDPCYANQRFEILGDAGWTRAPDYSLFTVPPGVNSPQLDMEFVVSPLPDRRSVLWRRNCNTENVGSTSAPTWYQASLQGRLLRTTVQCDSNRWSGYLYFVWSNPVTVGTPIGTLACRDGKVVAFTDAAPTTPTPTPTLTSVSGTATVFVPCPTIPLAPGDPRCGSQVGRRCPDRLCCSRYGYCQDDGGDSGPEWCGDGCQIGFGKCFAPPSLLSTVTAVCPTPHATSVSASTPVYDPCPNLPAAQGDRCGAEFGTKCREGICCSRWGWCQDDGGDSGEDWCGEGCQVGFGKCWVGDGPLATAVACPTPAP